MGEFIGILFVVLLNLGIGLIAFFYPDILIKINEPNPFTRTERQKNFSRGLLRIFGSILIGTLIGGWIGIYAGQYFNPPFNSLPLNIKLSIFCFPLITILGMFFYKYAEKVIDFIRREKGKIDKKSFIIHQKMIKNFKIFSIILMLLGPILGLLYLKITLGS